MDNEPTTDFSRITLRNKFTGKYVHRRDNVLDARLSGPDGSCELHIHGEAISSPGTQFWLEAGDPRDGAFLVFANNNRKPDFEIHTRELGGISGFPPPVVAIRCKSTGRWWCVDPNPPGTRSAMRATAEIDDNDLARFWMESL